MIINLTDITGILGEWLDSEVTEIDPEVPTRVVRLLQEAYNVAADELDSLS